METKITFGVIATNRNFFADSLVASGRRKVLDKLAEFGIDTVALSETDTNLGAVEIWSDAQKCAALFKQHQDEIDGILVTLPNFGDEKECGGSNSIVRVARAGLAPCLPDVTSELTAAGRRDAFCGKISLSNNLYQYGIDYSLTESHTVDPDSEEFKAEILRFVQMCRVVKGMRKARLGCGRA